jgi:hypothetical protein
MWTISGTASSLRRALLCGAGYRDAYPTTSPHTPHPNLDIYHIMERGFTFAVGKLRALCYQAPCYRVTSVSTTSSSFNLWPLRSSIQRWKRLTIRNRLFFYCTHSRPVSKTQRFGSRLFFRLRVREMKIFRAAVNNTKLLRILCKVNRVIRF